MAQQKHSKRHTWLNMLEPSIESKMHSLTLFGLLGIFFEVATHKIVASPWRIDTEILVTHILTLQLPPYRTRKVGPTPCPIEFRRLNHFCLVQVGWVLKIKQLHHVSQHLDNHRLYMHVSRKPPVVWTWFRIKYQPKKHSNEIPWSVKYAQPIQKWITRQRRNCALS